MKNYEQYKRLIRFLSSTILLASEMGIYCYTWIAYYNLRMAIPYNRSGHWLMAAVYGLLLIVFSKLFGGLKLGYLKTSGMIYSQTLATLCTNGMIYLQITLLTKHFQNIIPLVIMTSLDFLLIAGWSYIFNQFYRKIYPPRKLLLIYGDRPVLSLMEKLHTRSDRFIIGEIAHISLELDILMEKIKQYDGVIINDVPSQLRNKILKFCYENSIRTYAAPKISDIIIRSAESIHMFDTPLMLCRNEGLAFEQRFFKRMMDIFISLIGLIVFSPFMILTACFVKLYDHGTILYKQKRLTIHNRTFYIYKFRSMKCDAEQDGIARLAQTDDDRITPIGKLIRKIRFDELPQLLNILKGEMSIVGPRPERPEIAKQYLQSIPEFNYRLKVKAGLTGYAQIYGKYNTSPYDKLKLDLIYIQNYSLLLDVKLMIMTVKILFMRESTEGIANGQITATIQKQ